jgi:membrane glycosyltransferase
VIFFSTVVALTGFAAWVMADILWRGGLTHIEAVLLVLFVPMFGMVALGFTQAVFGFLTLLRQPDPFSLARTLPEQPPKAEELPATAIALPIYNEDVGRVYEGLRTIYLDLARSG